VALVLIPVGGAVASPARQDTGQGAALYAELGCPACHGSRGQGFIAPALSGITLSFEEALGKLRAPTGGMPEYNESMISDQAFFDMYAYLRELGGLDIPEPPDLSRR
jgi:mono/diheme cytochrome c family protein